MASASASPAVITPSDTPLPWSVRHGPRITLTCKCGERNYVRYGDIWTCDKCGRRWNTRRIPMDQYAELRRTQLRYRRIPIAVAVLSLLCVIGFIIAGRAFSGLIIVVFAGTVYSMFARPIHRRKYRRELANLPSWEIEPE